LKIKKRFSGNHESQALKIKAFTNFSATVSWS
jgi:hypothetical protein